MMMMRQQLLVSEVDVDDAEYSEISWYSSACWWIRI